ncbi:MAG: hypothetical protein AAGU10_14240 [Methanosarcina mazei]|jgi:hypothetical protein|uniref:Uncharacterized protein n=3 Tax=Methanosarcina mazei TaxID=2209 RepID=A0A0F8M5S0_METMZ|nr:MULTISPECIES: hypothetical protein [Methanosarcina]AKB64539.1 hypothetical protein MSMAS_1343 [Methanosarcina mazei S-6]AKB68451.1 hypothetical protein MSMAL_1908 [Methanosarcina mazei LYC]KKH33792.1 hypothetical protein DU37_02460 [Methanosarcina mazei]MDY0248135.1 hypothetical protein [Methanosarcina mazei]NLO31052.1 hypothetical protein [Methanosarcina mazei]
MSILNESRAIDLGLSSVKDNNELGVLRSIDFLTDQGTKYINQGLEPDAKRTIISIRDIGNAAALQKMELGVLISLVSLGRMAEVAREQKMSNAGLSIIYSLCAVGKSAVGQEMEAAVRIAVAYLGEITNSASLHNLKRESLVSTLAIGAIGKETSGQQIIRVPENGGIFSAGSGIFSSIQEMEPTIFTEELQGTLAHLMEHRGEIRPFQHTPIFTSQHFSDTDFRNFEDIIIKASNALGTMMLEPGEKFLVSYMLMTKLSIETFNGSEYIHEAESFE